MQKPTFTPGLTHEQKADKVDAPPVSTLKPSVGSTPESYAEIEKRDLALAAPPIRALSSTHLLALLLAYTPCILEYKFVRALVMHLYSENGKLTLKNKNMEKKWLLKPRKNAKTRRGPMRARAWRLEKDNKIEWLEGELFARDLKIAELEIGNAAIRKERDSALARVVELEKQLAEALQK